MSLPLKGRLLVSADHDLYDDEIAQLKAGLEKLRSGELSTAVLNRGIHLSLIRDDGTVERLCHHEKADDTATAELRVVA